jgi:hypothetical protein
MDARYCSQCLRTAELVPLEVNAVRLCEGVPCIVLRATPDQQGAPVFKVEKNVGRISTVDQRKLHGIGIEPSELRKQLRLFEVAALTDTDRES